ncbi:hypothetical protein BU14_0071s0036 [Porphyra umbilicalis]|uniref:J domain-containing protein n=1 Tax=Porphyra umbilicalis TaxID=2786 RepID=A0A1X6PGI3_PORUM|nr:hypothetical protein BU14_0071s0036 [Porphyra umbilicalis]|eukprot:OSX79783.1 hypothetical protein BU14_0071s0036 [Porphyra umbilicalis]
MASAIVAGAAIAGAALLARTALLSFRSGAAAGGRAAGAAAVPRAFAGGFERTMDKKEAALILGLPAGGNPSKAAVREAHRRLMRVNHPDSGGSTYVATKVNEAKELLLGGKRGQSVF